MIPMLYYLREHQDAAPRHGMSDRGDLRSRRRVRGPADGLRNPWRKPRFLQAITGATCCGRSLPVVIAVIFSFNAGRSREHVAGVLDALVVPDPDRLDLHDPTLRAAMLQTFKLSILTVIIAVPLGTLFAIGIDRWHGRPARRRELHDAAFVRRARDHPRRLAVPLVHDLFKNVVPLGTIAQVLGL